MLAWYRVIRWVVSGTILLAGVLAGCQLSSSESANQASASPSLLATRVAGSLQRIVETGVGTLSPLSADRLPLVRVTADVAANTVLVHKEETGWPDPDIAWKDGRCVLLAWYERHPMTRAPDPPPPSAVYVIRLVGEVDGSLETWVIVEATTGELGAAFRPGPSSSDCP